VQSECPLRAKSRHCATYSITSSARSIWSAEASDEAKPNRIIPVGKYDRNFGGCRFGGDGRSKRAGDHYRNRLANQIGCQLRQAVVIAIRPAEINRNVPAFNVRFGSLADIFASDRDVRFTPESGHSTARVACPLWANSGQNDIQ
jgi:hypothetical protein